MDQFNPRQCSNHKDVNIEGNYINPFPAAVQHPHNTKNSLQGGNYASTQGMSQNHSGQDYLLEPQPEMEGAGYHHPQRPYKNFPVNGGQVYSQPLMSEGSFHHDQVPQGPSFPGVIQPNPAFGSNFYLPSPHLYFPKEEYFHPHPGTLPVNPSGFISPPQLPFPPPNPFMLGLMPEYRPSQVKSESFQGPSMIPPSFSSRTASAAPRTYQHEDFSTKMAHSTNTFRGRSQPNDSFNNNKKFERNNNFGDERECNVNFQNMQSKQTSINSSNKISAKVWNPEHKSPIVETSPKDKTTTKSENNFSYSTTNTNQANSIAPKSSNVKRTSQFSKPNCPKPRSTLTISSKRRMSLSDLSTASPYKLTSPTPVTPEQLAATRMKMVFSPKLVGDTPCPGCANHKSHMTVQCASPPVKELSDDLTFSDGTPDNVCKANVTLDGLLCEMCGEYLELDPNEIINVSYLTGDNASEKNIFSDDFFDNSPLGNIECAQTSLAGKMKKVSEAIIILSDDDDIKSPIGKSRRTMQFKGKQKKRSNESIDGTIKKEITRPFVCNVCPKTYIREHALKTHMKTHLGYSSVKLSMEPVPNESKKKEVNDNFVSRNADIENKSLVPKSPKGFIFNKLQSGIGGPFIQKSSITDDEINDLLISSDDEAAPPIFMPKLERTIKKELMENTNTEGENLFMMKDKTEDSFNTAQDFNEKIVPPICRPQILKESAKHEKVKAEHVLCPRTCWYCLSVVSTGPWQVHKYQPNKYLCSSCFQMHKAKAENKEKHEKNLHKKVHCEGLEETSKVEEILENVDMV